MKTKLVWKYCLLMAAFAVPCIAQDAEPTREPETREKFELQRRQEQLRLQADFQAQQAQQRLRDDLLARTAIERRTQSNSATFNRQQDHAFGNRDQLARPTNLAPTVFGFNRISPKLAEAYRESNGRLSELVQLIKSSKDEESKLELKAEVKTLLETKYDAYLDHHEQPLLELEERLVKLREEFDSRKKAKEDLVKNRLDTIWYDAIGLGWPENQSRSNRSVGWSLNNLNQQNSQNRFGFESSTATRQTEFNDPIRVPADSPNVDGPAVDRGR